MLEIGIGIEIGIPIAIATPISISIQGIGWILPKV